MTKALLQQARDALQYAADDMSPISVDNCTCPVCVALAALDAELAKPEPAKIDTSSLSHYLEKSIMDDRKEWRALIGEPVAWGRIGPDEDVYSTISPRAHDRAEGSHTTPLYRLPGGM